MDIPLFVFEFHHAILDGWSLASFNTELNNLYISLLARPEQGPLVLLSCTYKDHIVSSLVEKRRGSIADSG